VDVNTKVFVEPKGGRHVLRPYTAAGFVGADPRVRPSTTATVRLPVTFSVVRNMSGIVSTASRMPMPSTGTFAAASTGTIAMMLPGTPGTANDDRIVVKTIDASCGGASGTP